jgi:hypothetical protein
VNLVPLLLIGTVSLNVRPLFPPRPQNSWVSGSSVELPKALLLIRKHVCAITSRYSKHVKASLLECRRADSGFSVKPLYRKSLSSSSLFSRFSWQFSVAEDARDAILGHPIGTACRATPVRRS